MRKFVVSMLVMMCLLFAAVPVYAKDKAVTISSVAGTTSSVTLSGTTEALAVVIQVRNANNDILLIHSMGTVDGKFTGTIDEDVVLEAGKDYTVYVADFEGGNWATTTLSIKAANGQKQEIEDSKTPTTPKMGDTNILMNVGILMLCGAALIAAGLFVGLRRNNCK